MNWIDSGQFKIANRNGRHYVFRRSNAGNTEINIPKTIVSKGQAKKWLKNNPNKVRNPTRHTKREKAKGKPPLVKNGTIKITNKTGKIHIRPVPKPLPLKLSPKPSNITFKCNTTFFKKVRNSNGATGFAATEAANRNQLYTVPVGKMSVNKGMAKIGKGTQGVVFLAYTSKSGIHPVTIKVSPYDKTIKKQTAILEYEIQKKLFSIIPNNIPQPYGIIEDCHHFIPESTWSNNKKKNIFNYGHQVVEFSEYITGGSLPGWMSKMGSRLNDSFMRNLISQMLHVLYFIQKRIPGFRHNDLHLDNILVKQNSWTSYPTFVLNDFGWARLSARGSNPLVNSNKHASRWGIGTKTSSRYDMHLFLNELHKWMEVHGGRSKFPLAIAFIEKHVPKGYLGTTNTYISESRLKYDIQYPGLPNLKDIIKDPYVQSPKNFMKNIRTFTNIHSKIMAHRMKNIKVLMNQYNKATPRTRANINAALSIMSVKRHSPSSPRTPSTKGSAPKRAQKPKANAPRRPKTNNITPKKLSFGNIMNNWAKVTPRSFLKLTPRRRALVIAARRSRLTGPQPKHKFMVIPKAKSKTPSPQKPKSKTPSPIKIPASVYKSNKFNKLRVSLLKPGKNNNYYYRWANTRATAENVIRNRLRRGLPMFTPSPAKANVRSPPKSKTPSPKKPTAPFVVPKFARRHTYKVAYVNNRMKIKGNGGRVVFVNGASVSLDYLKNIAARYGVNISGLRKKTEIANKIFRNNK
jgi:Protein kinase domain